MITTKEGARVFIIYPARNGVVVREDGFEAQGRMSRDVTWVFTDTEALSKFLFEEYVDIAQTLKDRAKDK